MFDIGFTELLVIAIVALIVLGPKRLPEVARTAGQWMGKLRRFMSDVKQDIDREMQQAELAELRNLKRELDETRRVMEETSGQLLAQADIAAAAEPGAAPSPSPLPAAAPAQPAESSPPAEPAAPKNRTPRRRKKAGAPKPAHE